jgi:hypothetical protein
LKSRTPIQTSLFYGSPPSGNLKEPKKELNWNLEVKDMSEDEEKRPMTRIEQQQR